MYTVLQEQNLIPYRVGISYSEFKITSMSKYSTSVNCIFICNICKSKVVNLNQNKRLYKDWFCPKYNGRFEDNTEPTEPLTTYSPSPLSSTTPSHLYSLPISFSNYHIILIYYDKLFFLQLINCGLKLQFLMLLRKK